MRPNRATETTACRTSHPTPPVYTPVTRPKALSNQRNRNIFFPCPGRSSIRHSAGLSVSATSPEIATDTAIVTANCL